MAISATTKAYPTRSFQGKVAFIHPHLDALTRTLRVRFDMDNGDHELRPGMYASVKLELPVAQLPLIGEGLTEDWRRSLGALGALQAMFDSKTPWTAAALVQAALAHTAAAHGLVLTVPDRAVIDTGSRKIVYRLADPGVYEGVEVELGPRSGGFYPVLRGLEPGEQVAAGGAFLIDAETRLNGGVGSTYFGARGGPAEKKPGGAVRPSMGDDEEAKVKAALARLSPEDRKLALAQGYCPILKNSRLGSMGRPVKVQLDGQTVFLCCKGCEKEAREHPAQTLSTVTTKAQGRPSLGADSKEAAIQAALAQLSPADRRLAEAQRFCAVRGNSRLGSMDVPFKVMIRGEPVFLCCDACADRAQANADATLATVRKLRAAR
jgi:Cu(I)/Ag(I) efflux system membrane fusion protein